MDDLLDTLPPEEIRRWELYLALEPHGPQEWERRFMGLVIAALGGEGISDYLHQVPDWARPAPEAEPDSIIRTAMRAFSGRKQPNVQRPTSNDQP